MPLLGIVISERVLLIIARYKKRIPLFVLPGVLNMEVITSGKIAYGWLESKNAAELLCIKCPKEFTDLICNMQSSNDLDE